MFIAVAALIAARGTASGSMQLAWLFVLLVPLFNPTSPGWPGRAVVAYVILGGAIGVSAFMCAVNFATRFANRMLGILVCDGKAEGAGAYAPNELDAIGTVAHATGLALDLLRIEALEVEIAVLRAASAT